MKNSIKKPVKKKEKKIPTGTTPKPKQTKPKNRREQTKFPALNKQFNLKTRQDILQDFDYIDKLNDKEKAFLNNFLEEEIITNFNHRGKKLNTSKKDKRRCYNNNNARNRCILTKERAMGTINYLEDIYTGNLLQQTMNPEEYTLFNELLNKKLAETPIKKTKKED